MPSLTVARHQTTAAIIGNYLYVIGGGNAGGQVNTIERATINPADGTLSTWQVVTTMTTARYSLCEAVVASSVLYLLGGSNGGGTYLNDYETYRADASGNLTLVTHGTMTVAGSAITAGTNPFAFISGNCLVMVGGKVNDVYNGHCCVVFPITSNGTLGNGTWAPDLNKSYAWSQGAVINNEVYLTGGYDGSFYHQGAHATFNPATGTLGAWQYDSPDIPTCGTHGQTVVVGNRIYLVGGFFASGASPNYNSIIQTTTVDPNSATKALARWSTYGSMPLKIHGQMGLMIGNKAYLFGGYNYEVVGSATRETNYYVIHDDGSIGPATPGPNLTIAKYWGEAVAVNGYVYVLGGHNGSWCDQVERAPINADGTLGSFTLMPYRLPTAFGEIGAAAVVGPYVYLFGGWNGSVYSGSIYRARVNSDGSLAPWENYETPLPGMAALGQAMVVGSKLYLTRSYNSGANNEVWVAPINPDYSMGTFTSAPSLNNSTYGAATCQIGNYLYHFGGWSSSGELKTVERAPLDTSGNLGNWAVDQVGGQDLMAAPSSHWVTPPYVYGNWAVLFGGYAPTTNPAPVYNIDTIQVGSIH